MSERIIILLGVIGSIASILAFFEIGSSDIPRAPMIYIPVAVAALVSFYYALVSQWKIWLSASTDFHVNPPEKRLRNTAITVFVLCMLLIGYLFVTSKQSQESGSVNSSESA